MKKQLTPKEIVLSLDKFIVGQDKAKRAVAIALRNRWRRAQVSDSLRHEITPKNILLIGPTGVGKTEIARRLAKLANAPFIKVEVTKFTEVGYVGRDVEAIIRDLAEIAIKSYREEAKQKKYAEAELAAESRILDVLLPPSSHGAEPLSEDGNIAPNTAANAVTREKFRKKLGTGALDDREIEIETLTNISGEVFVPPGMEDLATQIQGVFQNIGGSKKDTRKLKISEARKILIEEEAANLINDDAVKLEAVHHVEQNGIVFLDEIDKIAVRKDTQGTDVSRQGVQRDLLPLVEGASVSTKYGIIRTDHILFIASGAFHLSRPSDLIPELQGRFPIRVELDSLSIGDFERILTQTDVCLIKQYQELLATEGVKLKFSQDAIRRLAGIAFQVNEKTENIGARRLYTVIEKLLEELSFESDGGTSGKPDSSHKIDAAYVNSKLSELSENEDLSRYVL